MITTSTEQQKTLSTKFDEYFTSNFKFILYNRVE